MRFPELSGQVGDPPSRVLRIGRRQGREPRNQGLGGRGSRRRNPNVGPWGVASLQNRVRELPDSALPYLLIAPRVVPRSWLSEQSQ